MFDESLNHSVYMSIAKPTCSVCAIFLSSPQHNIICFVPIYIIQYVVTGNNCGIILTGCRHVIQTIQVRIIADSSNIF